MPRAPDGSTPKRAVVLIGHGSKLDNADEALKAVCQSLQAKEPTTLFQVAFLDITTPSIPEAVESCVSRGAEEVVILPYFVHSGKHVRRHIPAIVTDMKARYPNNRISLAPPLGFDERIVSVILERIQAAQ